MLNFRHKQGKVLWVGFFLVVLILLAGYFTRCHEFLSLIRPVQPGILVVEGWLDELSLQRAKTIYYNNSYRIIITTGITHSRGYEMGSAGMVVFGLQNFVVDSTQEDFHIALTHRGTRVGKEYPHFSIWADTTEIGNSFSHRKKGDYFCQTKVNTPIKAVYILFDNDTFSRWNDRNFYFYSLEINDNEYHPGNCSIQYLTSKGNEYIYKKTFMPDFAHDASFYFTSTGIPDSVVIPIVTTQMVKSSRTYSTALDVKTYLQTKYPDNIPPITVVTKGIHARRTYVSYRKAFGKSVDIGIMSLPDEEFSTKNWWMSLVSWKQVFYESIGLLYVIIAL